MREIVLDTETTGFEPDEGHRIIEIGCVELENHIPTGRHLQLYINPEREVPAEAIAIHGITNEFLKDKPVFLEVYTEFAEFIEGAKLVIHNAAFDIKFINHHFQEVGHPPVAWPNVIDTLGMARRKFPGAPANLDALCRRFGIDNTERTFHGALLDSELLAEVYLELIGGRQHGLGLNASRASGDGEEKGVATVNRTKREPRPHTVPADELAAHKEMLQNIQNALWHSGE